MLLLLKRESFPGLGLTSASERLFLSSMDDTVGVEDCEGRGGEPHNSESPFPLLGGVSTARALASSSPTLGLAPAAVIVLVSVSDVPDLEGEEDSGFAFVFVLKFAKLVLR